MKRHKPPKMMPMMPMMPMMLMIPMMPMMPMMLMMLMIPMMPMMLMIPMMHSVGKNSAARRNNHAAAIKPHTWRKLAGRYKPQRQQRRRRCYSNGRRTSAIVGAWLPGVAFLIRRSFHAAPAGPASIFQPSRPSAFSSYIL